MSFQGLNNYPAPSRPSHPSTALYLRHRLKSTSQNLPSNMISHSQIHRAMNAMEIAKEVSKASDEFSKQARQTLDKFLKQIFDGSYLSTRRLYPMIADGTWLDAPKV